MSYLAVALTSTEKYLSYCNTLRLSWVRFGGVAACEMSLASVRVPPVADQGQSILEWERVPRCPSPLSWKCVSGPVWECCWMCEGLVVKGQALLSHTKPRFSTDPQKPPTQAQNRIWKAPFVVEPGLGWAGMWGRLSGQNKRSLNWAVGTREFAFQWVPSSQLVVLSRTWGGRVVHWLPHTHTHTQKCN